MLNFQGTIYNTRNYCYYVVNTLQEQKTFPQEDRILVENGCPYGISERKEEISHG